MPYLLKTEPNKYSFDDLVRDGETTWDGISNNQALLTLRNMKKGDKLVIYHSNIGKAAVGLGQGRLRRRHRPEEPERPHRLGQATQARKTSRRDSRGRCLPRVHPLPPVSALRGTSH